MEPLKQLRMQRNLDIPLPEMPPLAAGLAIVDALVQEGPKAWEAIITDSFGAPTSYDKIRNDPACAPERVFLLMVNGVSAATTTVQLPAARPGWGVVHMVGVHRDFLGHGYGRLMVLRALHDMQQRGLQAATLTTDDFRLPAIRTYLGLGFAPVMEDDTMPGRWDAVNAKLATYRKQG